MPGWYAVRVNNGPGIISVKQRPQQGIQVKILAEMLQVLIRIEAALTADGEAVSAPRVRRNCAECGVEFEPARSDAIYHNGACRARSSRKRRGIEHATARASG